MSLSDHLAELAEKHRQQREQQTAVGYAIADALRAGTAPPHPAIVQALLARRVDGTAMTTRQHPTETAGPTNQADAITHTPTPLSGRDEE